MNQAPETLEFLDPFAENGPELINPMDSFYTIVERYTNNEIEHDYSADRFVHDTETIIMDASFANMIDQANQIAAITHMLCGHDQALRSSVEQSSLLGQHGEHAEHQHDHEHADNDIDEDDELIDPKTGKKKKRQRWR